MSHDINATHFDFLKIQTYKTTCFSMIDDDLCCFVGMIVDLAEEKVD